MLHDSKFYCTKPSASWSVNREAEFFSHTLAFQKKVPGYEGVHPLRQRLYILRGSVSNGN